jgi:hypothetical protein
MSILPIANARQVHLVILPDLRAIHKPVIANESSHIP